MNIIETIVNMKQYYYNETGKQPKSLYLGDTEYKSLMFSNSYTAYVHYHQEICGMKLFNVKAENHIGVGL